MRKLIYKEDNQGYYYELIEFKTDCLMDIEDFEAMSWSITGAGRMSTSFETFKEILEGYGFKVTDVKNIGRNAKIPKDINVIKGATGNY